MSLSKEDFIILADEMANDKLFFNKIMFHEKLDRMSAYLLKQNPRFKIGIFMDRINKTYKNTLDKMEVIK
jgi:hypothetical protein|tara:strand:- start:252 stop:461 length:210 start_codon:yes stop_codon:yes gene_type:complete